MLRFGSLVGAGLPAPDDLRRQAGAYNSLETSPDAPASSSLAPERPKWRSPSPDNYPLTTVLA